MGPISSPSTPDPLEEASVRFALPANGFAVEYSALIRLTSSVVFKPLNKSVEDIDIAVTEFDSIVIFVIDHKVIAVFLQREWWTGQTGGSCHDVCSPPPTSS